MISAILGAATALGGALYSGIKSGQANKKARLYLDDYDRDSNNRANWGEYRDYTQTATAQAQNTNMRRLMLENSQNMTGQHEVGHTTRAAEASEKQRLNDTLAQIDSNIVVNGEALANQARSQRASEKQWVAGQRMGMAQSEAQQNAIAGSQLIQSGINLALSDMRSTLNGNGDKVMNVFGKKNGNTTIGNPVDDVRNSFKNTVVNPGYNYSFMT